jgi:hypothetical protein
MHRGIAVPILSLILGASLAGCLAETGDGGILVLKNIHPESQCLGTGSETEPSIGSGRLELQVASSYLFFAQMKSRITALAGQEDQRTIIATGAKVDIAFPNSTVFSAAELAQLKTDGLTRFEALFSQVIKPNGGVADAAFNLIPVGLVRAIQAKTTPSAEFSIDAVATFTVVGQMSGGSVNSQLFTYPITIGNGQVVNVLGACPLPKGTTMLRNGYVCNPFQDGVVDCCSDGRSLTCPASVAL